MKGKTGDGNTVNEIGAKSNECSKEIEMSQGVTLEGTVWSWEAKRARQ